jgi:large subunit ribosomal protein L41
MFKPSPVLSARLRLTTKQVNGGYYKGNRSGSMGSHTEFGNYIIDYRKTRHYNVPDLSACSLTPFVTKEMEPTKWERTRADGTIYEPPKVDGMDLLKSWRMKVPNEYDWVIRDEESTREARKAEELQSAELEDSSVANLEEQVHTEKPHVEQPVRN